MPSLARSSWARPALLALVIGWLSATAATTPEARADEQSPQWLTGERLRQQLDEKVSITWSNRSGIPLRQALNHLGQSQQVAVLLDRRVDPDQKIELVSDDATLDATLKLIAARLHIGSARVGVSQVGSVIYFGPEATARRVRTLAALRFAEARRLPPEARNRFSRLIAWHWDDLSTPRDLFAALASECHIEIQGTEQIPHDLWAAADWPAMNFCDRLTLLAAQYDLTFSIDPTGDRVTLVPMPQSVEISREYRLHVAAAEKAEAIATKLSQALPDAHIQYRDGTLSVRGRAEDQDVVERLLSGQPAKKTTVTNGEKRYTLPAVSMGVGDLIRTLGRRLNLDVQFDDAAIQAAGLSLNTEVKVNVKNATEDELLHDVLGAAGLTFVRNGNSITVRPKK